MKTIIGIVFTILLCMMLINVASAQKAKRIYLAKDSLFTTPVEGIFTDINTATQDYSYKLFHDQMKDSLPLLSDSIDKLLATQEKFIQKTESLDSIWQQRVDSTEQIITNCEAGRAVWAQTSTEYYKKFNKEKRKNRFLKPIAGGSILINIVLLVIFI